MSGKNMSPVIIPAALIAVAFALALFPPLPVFPP